MCGVWTCYGSAPLSVVHASSASTGGENSRTAVVGSTVACMQISAVLTIELKETRVHMFTCVCELDLN